MKAVATAALLLSCSQVLATTSTASILTSSPVGLDQTLLAVGSGVAVEQLDTIDLVELANRDFLSTAQKSLASSSLLVFVDGEQIKLSQWRRASQRLRLFLDDSEFTEGSIEYSYRIKVRGLAVHRSTKLTDGQLELETTVCGSMGRIDFAKLLIVATESGEQTAIRATLTVHTPIGDRCRLVDRIARRRMPGPMKSILWRLEARGRELGTAGEPDLFGVVGLFVRSIQNGLR